MVVPLIQAPSSAFVAALQRVWGDARARTIALYLLVMLLCALGQFLPQRDQALFASLERSTFDAEMRLLREFFPTRISNDAVLIGIDEGTEERYTEPVALWNFHLAALLDALAEAKPLAVGIDVTLPKRPYDDIVPGLTMALYSSIRSFKEHTPLVFAQTVDKTGALAEIHSTYRHILGEAGLGIDQQLKDPDNVARRFSEQELGKNGAVQTLVGQILRRLNIRVQQGYIDYSAGAVLDYIPMQTVIDWSKNGQTQELAQAFGGRIVLVGGVVRDIDRWDIPLKILNLPNEEGPHALSQPGVAIHLQALRSHLANGLIQPVPWTISWLLFGLPAGAVFMRFRTASIFIGIFLVPLILTVISLALLRTSQLMLPVASIVLTLWTALALRGVFDAVDTAAERIRLKRSFSGQVSPAVLDEIMAGGLAPGSSARLLDVCVIFSDIRGFTTLSEAMPPETVMKVLQRYFDRMVKAVHRYDGTIDKFIGDGMMILFGAPRPLADPCSDAVQCALTMLHALDELNVEFAREGLPTLVIGIGINYGKVVVGNIGSTERHNYSAIGDAVNVAARIEGLTKEVGRKILITESVVSRIGDRFNFEPLGERLVKGHSPVKVWGIRAERVAGATSGGAASAATTA
jgi:adenylate cyclase